MKSVMSSVVALLFFELLIAISTINISFCNGSSYMGCIEIERQALLRFKQGLKDPSNRLASWNIGDEDCCRWASVVCDNFTGHVLQLHLGNPFEISEPEYARSRLVGKINPSLLGLKHLVYLDLSGNNFSANLQIPTFLGSMTNLEYLNLSTSRFEGLIPPQLGNLSHLQYLHLNQRYIGQLYAENLNWLSDLSLLEHLDLSNVNLSKASDWLLEINTLRHLVALKCSDCQLSHFPLLPIANFSSLATLDLHQNNFDEYLIPSWVFGLGDLVFLDLSFNRFHGPIPEGIQNLTSLRYLDLSWNDFNSSAPNWFNRFSRLEYLSLGANGLRGMVLGDHMGNWSTFLETLDLSFNDELEGKVPRSFERLCNLKSISFSAVNLSQEISEILDIFSGCVLVGLEFLDLSNTQLFGHLDDQLGQLKNVVTLNFASNSISGPIPMSLGQLSSLKNLDFSNNKLNGTLCENHFFNLTSLEKLLVSENSLKLEVSPDWVPPFQLYTLGLRSCYLGPQFPPWLASQKLLDDIDVSNSRIDDRIPAWFWKSFSVSANLNLSHNKIHGAIPNLTRTILYFDLSSNNFSGPLPQVFDSSLLDLSNNAFSGTIFHFFCMNTKEPMGIRVLNLQSNFLSGELPDCWSNFLNLHVLNLGNNKITGILLTSMGILSSLRSLHLHKNNLSGTIPMSLKNCTKLGVLDLSKNKFIGNVPKWIGESVSRIKVLNLHSNKFHGLLPLQLCGLGYLQILDLADNNLSGTVPRCVNNFSSMVTTDKFAYNEIVYQGLIENTSLVMKGKVVEYNTILNLVRSIDLSRNNFSGEIPLEVTNLGALLSLNLSHNSFIGTIPESIGAMKSLESIDVSANQLSSKIPQSFSKLTFLSYLNLSNNKLTGEIPSSTQLQSFDPSSFRGNELCGSPLEKCSPEMVPNYDNGNDRNEHEVDWTLYVSMALGFVMGFWGVLVPLFVSRRWRCTYYSLLNQLWDKFYVTVLRRCY